MTALPPFADAASGPILLCAGTDAGAAARLAETAAALLSDRDVVVLTVWEPPPASGGYDAVMDALYDTHADLRAHARRAAADAAGAACEVLDARGLDVSRRVVADERGPWQTILDVADELGAAGIVAGATETTGRHRGALGHEARALAHRTRRPLLLLPADGTPPSSDAPALFAYDGSVSAGHAIGVATQLLLKRPGVVVTTWQTASSLVGAARIAVPDEVARKGAEGLDSAHRREAEARAEGGAARLGDAGWTAEGMPVETARSVPSALIAVADERDAAVVVTGTRGRSRIAAALLGSTAEGILRHAHRPVLLVPPPAEA